jgi:hypothetical protein
MSVTIRHHRSDIRLFRWGNKSPEFDRLISEWFTACVNQASRNVRVLFDCEVWIDLEFVAVVGIIRPDLHELALRC